MAGTVCLEANRPAAASGGATGVLDYGFDQLTRDCQWFFLFVDVGILPGSGCLGLCLGSHPLGHCFWGHVDTPSQKTLEGSL